MRKLNFLPSAAELIECSQCSVLESDITAAPNSNAYDTTIAGFWSGQARDDKPTCVVQPTTREHVAAVVRTLTRWQCQFSVKGGGHTPFPGAASINDGVTIDLAKLNTISVDKNANIAYVGSGLKWGQIYEYLEPKNMMVAGGRDSLVGIGGLIVGGKMPPEQSITRGDNLHGFVCRWLLMVCAPKRFRGGYCYQLRACGW